MKRARIGFATVLSLALALAVGCGRTPPEPDADEPFPPRKLTSEKLDEWRGKLRHRDVAISLPRFSVRGRYRLNQALTALGMGDAFERDRADFSGMVNPQTLSLFLDEVVHEAAVQVNEKGTVGAAMSYAKGKDKGGAFDPPVTFRADHPFLFLIYDESTSSILFVGRVADPGQE
ncbi:MAG: serpin family protein [Gemmataceae bacterium]